MNNDVVIVQLDRPRILRFNHTAIKTLVAITGQNLEELDDQIRGDNLEMVEKLAYCGLLKDAKDHGETLTLERTVELLDEAPVYSDMLSKVFGAWNAAFGVVPEGNQPAPAELPAKGSRSTGKKASE